MFLHTPKAVPSVLSSHTRSLGRTFNRQDEPASAAEGCLSDHKKCPQGLKPVLHRMVNVRAEARTLQRVGSHAASKAPIFVGPFTARLKSCLDTKPKCRDSRKLACSPDLNLPGSVLFAGLLWANLLCRFREWAGV